MRYESRVSSRPGVVVSKRPRGRYCLVCVVCDYSKNMMEGRSEYLPSEGPLCATVSAALIIPAVVTVASMWKFSAFFLDATCRHLP